MSNLELDCKWHFAKQLGGREDGPNDPMNDNFKKTPYSSLIRESIQNSLDVPLNSNQPVRVEFSIGRIRLHEYSNFFELKKHIIGCINHFPQNDDAITNYKPMIDYFNSLNEFSNLYYIKIADYNTIGMKYIKGDTTQPFFAFVRAAGVSSKNDATAGGSFGFGKAAYFYISPLRTIFVSTQTIENEHFFEGVSSLCTHNLEDDDMLRVSVGYYDNNDGEPVSLQERIPLKFRREQPGTDIYILGIDASDRESIYREMIEAVLRNFWMAIESNSLEVKVNETEINHNNISELFDKFFPEDIDDSPRERKYNPRPYWEAVHNKGLDKKHIVIEENLPTLGHVTFYAIKSKNAKDKIIYMRRPQMLVKARRTQSSNGFYGVFICDDIKGNEILRKTENPAHNEWVSSNWKENGHTVSKGKTALDEIENFIIKVMERMFSNQNNEVQQIQGLEEFLYIPTAVEDDELDNGSLSGDVIGHEEDESSSISTTLENPKMSTANQPQAIGKVLKSNNTLTKQKPNKDGDSLSGHSDNKRKNHGGGGLSTNKIDGHTQSDEDGISGASLKEINVKYRAFANSVSGQILHYIIIHSENEILDGRIDLIIGGEQSNVIVPIKSCEPQGVINGNTITSLHIHRGKTILIIKFTDNMKHAIKLDAYELK